MFSEALTELVDLELQLEVSLTQSLDPGKKMCLFVGEGTAAFVLPTYSAHFKGTRGDFSQSSTMRVQRGPHPSYHMLTGTRSLTLNLCSLNTSMINGYTSNNRENKGP